MSVAPDLGSRIGHVQEKSDLWRTGPRCWFGLLAAPYNNGHIFSLLLLYSGTGSSAIQVVRILCAAKPSHCTVYVPILISIKDIMVKACFLSKIC